MEKTRIYDYSPPDNNDLNPRHFNQGKDFILEPLVPEDLPDNTALLQKIISDFPFSYSLKYQSPYDSKTPENDMVYAEFFLAGKDLPGQGVGPKLPQANNDTLVILLHGFGSSIGHLDNYYHFTRVLLDKGYNCIFFNLPFHLNRIPSGEKSGERLLGYNDLQTLQFYHQSVVDLKKLMDILTVNYKFKKIILYGFSLGSMVATITAGCIPSIYKVIIIFGGGNWHEIHWNSSLSFILKGNCLDKGRIDRKKCHEFYQRFPAFLEEFKKTDMGQIDFNLEGSKTLKEKTLKMCFLCDPLSFAHKINKAKILMFNSKFDHYFNRRSSSQLWIEMGKPAAFSFWKLHTSKILANKKAQGLILDFIKKEV